MTVRPLITCPNGHQTTDPKTCGTCEAETRRHYRSNTPQRPRSMSPAVEDAQEAARRYRGKYLKKHVNVSGLAGEADKAEVVEWSARAKKDLNEAAIAAAVRKGRPAVVNEYGYVGTLVRP